MKFGINGVNGGEFATGAGARAIATAAEKAGFDSIWTFEHVVAPHGYESTYPYSSKGKAPGLLEADLPDPLIWLTWAAAHTTDLLLGTGILILPQRNPLVLAKEVASLDVLSEGRIRLGIGVGWLREEFEALGIPFERRGARTDDAIQAMQALWAQDIASYDGEFFAFKDCSSLPRPPGGRTHITVGGHSEATARRAGQFGDGFYPAVDAASIAELGLVGAITRAADLVTLARQTAEDHDRDPDAIEMTLAIGFPQEPDVVGMLEAAGFHRLVLHRPREATIDNVDEVLADWAGKAGVNA